MPRVIPLHVSAIQAAAEGPESALSSQTKVRELSPKAPLDNGITCSAFELPCPVRWYSSELATKCSLTIRITEDYTQFTAYILTSGMLRKGGEPCRLYQRLK